MSELIEVTKPTFPYVIDEGAEVFESFTMIDRDRHSTDRSPLFFLVNADIRVDSGPDGHAAIAVRHSSARDRGGDIRHLLYMPLESVQFIHASEGSYTFQAWVVEPPRFYPEEAADQNPFLEAAEGKTATRDYLPPYISFGRKLALPTKVQITTVHGAQGKAWYEQLTGQLDAE